MVVFIIVVALIFMSIAFLINYKTDKKIKKTQELYGDRFKRTQTAAKLGELGTAFGFGTKIISNGYVADFMFGLPIWVFDRISYKHTPIIRNDYGWLKEEKSSIYNAVKIPWSWKSLLWAVSIYYICALVCLGILVLILTFG